MEQIIVRTSGLTIEEKKRMAEALAKFKSIGMCYPQHWDKVGTLYGPSFNGINVGFNYYEDPNQTHTPQQVLEMLGMSKKGHVHAELMAQYAEDAKTHAKPWELWQVKDDGVWSSCVGNPGWYESAEYRRKPKKHIVHGVEIPDLRVSPEYGEYYYLADPTESGFTSSYVFHGDGLASLWSDRGLCYQNTEEGEQAAIQHAKAMLGIV